MKYNVKISLQNKTIEKIYESPTVSFSEIIDKIYLDYSWQEITGVEIHRIHEPENNGQISIFDDACGGI